MALDSRRLTGHRGITSLRSRPSSEKTSGDLVPPLAGTVSGPLEPCDGLPEPVVPPPLLRWRRGAEGGAAGRRPHRFVDPVDIAPAASH